VLNVEIGDDSFDIFYDSLGICSMEREQKSKNLRMGTGPTHINVHSLLYAWRRK